jgi:hypothetical protein
MVNQIVHDILLPLHNQHVGMGSNKECTDLRHICITQPPELVVKLVNSLNQQAAILSTCSELCGYFNQQAAE